MKQHDPLYFNNICLNSLNEFNLNKVLHICNKGSQKPKNVTDNLQESVTVKRE